MGSRYKGSAQDVETLSAFINLTRASESLLARIHQRSPFSKKGLTTGQLGVLDALFHLGALCQKDLAAKVLTSSANVTMVVRNLNKIGLIQRIRDTADKRYLTLVLTQKGRRLMESLLPEHVRIIRDEMAVLTLAERRELRALCRRLGQYEH